MPRYRIIDSAGSELGIVDDPRDAIDLGENLLLLRLLGANLLLRRRRRRRSDERNAQCGGDGGREDDTQPGH